MVALGCSFALALAVAPLGSAESTVQVRPRVERHGVGQEVDAVLAPKLRAAGLTERDVTVEVSWSSHTAVITVHVGGRISARSSCRDCSDDALLLQISRTADEALAYYVQPSRTDRSTNTAPDFVPQRKIGPLGWGGVASLTLGVASVAAGAAMLGIGETRPDPSDQSSIRDFRPAGGAVLGIGAALAVTGGVLLGVDLHRRRHPTIAATAHPTGGGVVIAGRF